MPLDGSTHELGARAHTRLGEELLQHGFHQRLGYVHIVCGFFIGLSREDAPQNLALPGREWPRIRLAGGIELPQISRLIVRLSRGLLHHPANPFYQQLWTLMFQNDSGTSSFKKTRGFYL